MLKNFEIGKVLPWKVCNRSRGTRSCLPFSTLWVVAGRDDLDTRSIGHLRSPRQTSLSHRKVWQMKTTASELWLVVLDHTSESMAALYSRAGRPCHRGVLDFILMRLDSQRVQNAGANIWHQPSPVRCVARRLARERNVQ